MPSPEDVDLELFTTLTLKEDQAYDLSEGKRLAVVFNHVEFKDPDMPKRNGTEADVQAILATFSKLGFEVRIYDDLTSGEIRKVIYNLQTEPELACLSLFVLTHGERTVLCMLGRTDTVWTGLSSGNCCLTTALASRQAQAGICAGVPGQEH